MEEEYQLYLAKIEGELLRMVEDGELLDVQVDQIMILLEERVKTEFL